MKDRKLGGGSLTRRHFLVTGGAAAVASGVPLYARGQESEDKPKVTRFRKLGRTGFEVSDISIGGATTEANVFRYAYDHGVNYFDNAEGYGAGACETALGEALQHMDRKKIFITTKLEIKEQDTEQTIFDRFDKCQERLRTDHVDALFIHGAETVDVIDNPGFHAAIRRLKTDGRLKHAGVSCHGPRGGDGDSMGDVLVAAAEDGRFDLMLIAYNFMNQEEGGRVLAACKKHNVGTTAMKTVPGTVELPPFDPENPSGPYPQYIEKMVEDGMTREEAIRLLQGYVDHELKAGAQAKALMEEHGISTKEEYRNFAVKWVLSNPDMHTVCISFRDFDAIDRFIPLSGTEVARNDMHLLEQYRLANSSRYCRHGCTACAGSCSHNLPVSTIMRYAYYFTEQGREKHAMVKYARLEDRVGLKCLNCSAPCLDACPFGVDVRANLLGAHGVLTLA